jgi:hypothetical protein
MGDSRADFDDIITDSAVAYYGGGIPISITRNALTF